MQTVRPDGRVLPTPAADGSRPLLRQLGEHDQPGAGVLAALGVVGGGGQHGVRPALQPLHVQRVQLLRRDTVRVRLAADFVEGQQAREAVEGGVLQRLRHHRPGELLEAVEPALASLVGLLLEEGAQPGQGSGGTSRQPLACRAEGTVEHGTVGAAERLLAAVGAVDLEGHQQLERSPP